jgi:hypothetical protein
MLYERFYNGEYVGDFLLETCGDVAEVGLELRAPQVSVFVLLYQ